MRPAVIAQPLSRVAGRKRVPANAAENRPVEPSETLTDVARPSELSSTADSSVRDIATARRLTVAGGYSAGDVEP